MLQIKVERVVNQIVQHELLGKGGRQDEALYLHFDLRMSYYEENQSDCRSRGLHLLYHVRPGGSYVDVFSAVTDSPFDKIESVKEWKHEASHDSCWRDVSCFSKVYFEMAKDINQARKSRGQVEIAPKDMHEHNGFGLFDNLYEWVSVRITRKDPCDSYRKTIEVLK
jgi:hypothetical protein